MANCPHNIDDGPRNTISAGEKDQGVLRIRDHAPREKSDENDCQRVMATAPVNILQAWISDRARHQRSEQCDGKKKRRRIVPTLQRLFQEMNRRGDSSCSRGSRHPDEVAHPASRRHPLYIEPSEPPSAANRECEAHKPRHFLHGVDRRRRFAGQVSHAPRVR